MFFNSNQFSLVKKFFKALLGINNWHQPDVLCSTTDISVSSLKPVNKLRCPGSLLHSPLYALGVEGVVGDLHWLLLVLLDLSLGEVASQDRLLGSLPVNQILQLSCTKVQLRVLPWSWFGISKLALASDLEDGRDGKVPLCLVFTADHSLQNSLTIGVPG